MAYLITDECMTCGMCAASCPNDAISVGDEISVIDPDRCTECVGWNLDPTCVKECPVDAVILDPAHSESRDELLAKWRRLHPGETPRG